MNASSGELQPLLEALRQHGLGMHVRRFEEAALPEPMLRSLTNAELRDDLHIGSLAARRRIAALLRADARRDAALPDFGLILVLLSNVRTFHSWLRLTFQAAIFALALARLAPLRAEGVLFGAAAGVCSIGAAYALYGAWRYFAVAACVRDGHTYSPDWRGAALAAAAAAATAALVMRVLLAPGA